MKSRELARERKQRWVIKNQEHILAYARAYHAEHRKDRAIYDAKPDRAAKRLVATREWQKRNKERIRARKRAVRNTPKGIIENRLRVRLWHALKRNEAVKADSTVSICGCTLEELRAHIERQFRDGMTWENRGEWHVDHVRPVSAFNLLDNEQQRQCFHFTNLQPLWKTENLRKNNKIIAFLKAA